MGSIRRAPRSDRNSYDGHITKAVRQAGQPRYGHRFASLDTRLRDGFEAAFRDAGGVEVAP